MNFSTLSLQNGDGHARVLANNKRALENFFFLVAAEVTRLKFPLETASRPASQSRVSCYDFSSERAAGSGVAQLESRRNRS